MAVSKPRNPRNEWQDIHQKASSEEARVSGGRHQPCHRGNPGRTLSHSPSCATSLNCSAVPPSAINMTARGYYPESCPDSYIPYMTHLHYDATIPWLCSANPGNFANYNWVIDLTAPVNVTGVLSGAATVLTLSAQDSYVMGGGALMSPIVFGTGGMSVSPAFLVPDHIPYIIDHIQH